MSPADEDSAIRSCAELCPGDEIQALHHGSLLHRGTVTDIAPELGLFWIMDTLGGGRKLLELNELEIFRTAPAGGHSSLGTDPTAAYTLPGPGHLGCSLQ